MNPSSMSSDRVGIVFDYEGDKTFIGVKSGEKMDSKITSLTHNEPFCIHYDENGEEKVFYPFGINLVAKISESDSSKANLYFQDQIIIADSSLPLLIRAEKISKNECVNVWWFINPTFTYILSLR